MDSVKLEGRLKRPEYVAVTAAAYRRGIDTLERGCFCPADEAEMQGLKQIFSRGGFMRGYAMGCEDAGVIFPEAAGHTGPTIGRITRTGGNLARVLLTAPLSSIPQATTRLAPRVLNWLAHSTRSCVARGPVIHICA